MGGASQDGRSEPWPYVHSRSVILSRGWCCLDAGYPAVRTRPKNEKAPRASLSFMLTRDRARSLHGIRGYFCMQVSAVSLVHSSRSEDTGSSTNPAKRGVCTHHARSSSGRKTARPSFTLFEARGINSNIMVYSECMHVDGRPALRQLLG